MILIVIILYYLLFCHSTLTVLGDLHMLRNSMCKISEI